jgi:pSer/pThr/pTyr-binding forkhead associated (FHA) protein
VDVRLFVFKSNGSAREIPLKPGRYVVGRQEDANLRIPLPAVSRRHAEIVVDDDSLTVRDLGSSNGTYVNGERIQEAQIKPGDVLALGDFQLVAQINGVPMEVTPPEQPQTTEPSEPASPTAPTDTGDEEPSAPAPTPSESTGSDDDLGSSVTRTGLGPLTGGRDDDSSVFDFDFDLDDDDNPQL